MTATTSDKARVHEGETRLLLPNIRWETYEALLKDLGESRLRLTFDSGNLELISPSVPHERFKRMIGRMIETATEELGIPIMSGGSATFRKQLKQKGLEPDECYWVRNEHRVRCKTDIDLTLDPPPDLAIEIEITHGLVNRMDIHAALGVPELWHHDSVTLDVLLLQDDGSYASSDRSLNLPFLPPDEVDQFLQQLATTDETSWIRSFRAWVRAEIAPRFLEPEGP